MKNKLKKTAFALVAVALILTLYFLSIYKTSEMSFSGMGTVISLKLTGKAKENDQLIHNISEMLSLLEKSISANDTDSVLYKFNNSFSETEDKYIVEIAEISKDIYEKSGGAFDFTAGKLVSLWGIGFENEAVPLKSDIEKAVTDSGVEKIEVLNEKVTKDKDVFLDFGGIGKGYACDKVKDILQNSKIKKAVVSVGGSLLFYGKKAGGWTVGVKNPFDRNLCALTFSLKEGFVSTSGSYERYFTDENGNFYHHIFDTKTGYPVENDLVSVTVIGDSGAISDALSTACFVRGEGNCKELLDSYNAKAIFIKKDKTVSVYGNIDKLTLSKDFSLKELNLS